MAMQSCKECGQQISDKAKVCPHCGVKINDPSLFPKFALGFVALLVILWALNEAKKSIEPVKVPTSSIEPSASVSDAPPSAIMAAAEPINWVNQKYQDEMNNSYTEITQTKSLNHVYFESPYDGGSNLQLSVRKNHTGMDVYIHVSKGQFLCRYNGCEVAFKFDDGPIMSVTMVEADTHSFDILFVKLDSTEDKIISQLLKSKQLIIEPKFYDHGDEQFKFNVEGFKPL